ncbi:MAG: SPFH domain-containing protein [Lachnospiraceae bacterium]|nr:SPFH domain-containing protein [Lachnospiraceae bacterium]
MSKQKQIEVTERVMSGRKIGGLVLLLDILLYIGAGLGIFYCASRGNGPMPGLLLVVCVLYVIFGWIPLLGLKVLKPNEALVLTLFGKYVGTLKGDGFFYVNPFCSAFNPAAGTHLGQSGDVKAGGASVSADGTTVNINAAELMSKKISLKIMTLSNSKQKVNDVLGNPVEVAVAVMWRVSDTAKAVFAVDNFKEYLSLQCDTAVRNVVKVYPYDVTDNVDTTGDGEADDGSLRGSTEIVARRIREEIQEKVLDAGLEIVDARITYLAYAPEIAAAMLQRQQAAAVVDARKLIVDGAVGMVEMALDRLAEKQTVDLDEERKAAMVSNLLVVLCGNKDAQPIVNSGSLY